jgi:NitT/TauT family transport system ATP-binding protein
MSPRPGRIAAIVDVDLGARNDDTREASEFFKKITEVREALRGAAPSEAALLGPDDVPPAGLEDR